MLNRGLWLKGLGVLIGLGLFGWVIRDAIAQSQSVVWPPIPVQSMLVAFAMIMAARAFHAIAWATGVREVAPQIEWGTGVATYSVAFLGRYIPGKIWQVGGLVYLARQRGANPVDVGVFSFVFLVAYQLIGAIMLLLAYVGQDAGLNWMAVTAGTIAIALPLALIWYRYCKWIVQILPARWARYAHGVFNQPARATVVTVVLMAATWALLASGGYVIILGFQPTWDGTWVQSTAAILGGIMAGFMFFIAPSGVGVREAVMLVMLDAVGVDPISTIMIIVSHRLIMVAAELLWGLAGVAFLAIRPASDAP